MRNGWSRSRSYAVFIGGIAAGMLGSRLLAPLIASARGSRRTSAGQDPFELLIEDHRQIIALLDNMAAAEKGSTLRRSKMFLMLKRKLAKHALAEEDVVYPLLHGQAGHGEESKHLYDEHADMKILLFQLEDLLRLGADWRQTVGSLRDLIQRHINEEEQEVFPRLRGAIGSDRMPSVSGQIRREEALIL